MFLSKIMNKIVSARWHLHFIGATLLGLFLTALNVYFMGDFVLLSQVVITLGFLGVSLILEFNFKTKKLNIGDLVANSLGFALGIMAILVK